jgi:hypothetical protein
MSDVAPEPVRYLTVTGLLFPDNRLLLQPGYLTDDASYAEPDPESPLLVELTDDEGRITLRHRIPVAPFYSHPAVGQLAVAGKVPFPSGTRLLRFFRGDILLEQIEVARTSPRVTIEWSPSDPVEGRQTITWSGEHPEGRELHYTVCFHSSGAGWQPLTTTTVHTQIEVDFDELPGGRCRIGILATDGINTVLEESRTFRSPIKPCFAMILAPADEARVPAGVATLLQGQGYWREERRPELEELFWTSSIDGDLGTGQLVEANLSPGVHRIELRAGRGRRQGTTAISLLIGNGEE